MSELLYETFTSWKGFAVLQCYCVGHSQGVKVFPVMSELLYRTFTGCKGFAVLQSYYIGHSQVGKVLLYFSVIV